MTDIPKIWPLGHESWVLVLVLCFVLDVLIYGMSCAMVCVHSVLMFWHLNLAPSFEELIIYGPDWVNFFRRRPGRSHPRSFFDVSWNVGGIIYKIWVCEIMIYMIWIWIVWFVNCQGATTTGPLLFSLYYAAASYMMWIVESSPVIQLAYNWSYNSQSRLYSLSTVHLHGTCMICSMHAGVWQSVRYSCYCSVT